MAADGFILDIQGPYFSDVKNNDASILKNEMQQDNNRLRQWVMEDDIFVVDRGYRDSVQFLEDLHLNVKMPPLLGRNRRQFTTEEANRSRIISKTRWIIEARNGHLKNIFKIFKEVFSIHICAQIKNMLKIGCALINAFHPTIHMHEATEEQARRMIEIAGRENDLMRRVIQNNLVHQRGGQWFDLENYILDFPQLSLEYLHQKTFGTYQVKIAPAYVQDTTERAVENDFVIQGQLVEPGLFKAKIFSRFTQATKHILFIRYITENNCIDPVPESYCTCKVGAKTLGLCAHVASTIWYLGYARHQHNVKYPSDNLVNIILDARNHNEEPLIEN